jgi:hypothetical protein
MFRAAAASRAVNAADAAWLRNDPVLVGPMLPSKQGGALGEDQLSYLFEQYGWRQQRITPQTLRSNWVRWHKLHTALALQGGALNLGHRSTVVTGRNYDAEDVATLVRVALETAHVLRSLGPTARQTQ